MTAAAASGANVPARRTGTKADAALALKLAGATWTEIADALEYASATHAREAATRRAADSLSQGDREQARQIAVGRYERLLRGVWSKAITPDNPEHLPAVRTARELIDRIVDVQGAAMPKEFVVHSPTDAELQAWISKVTGINPDDIVEAEVVDYPEVPPGELGGGTA